MRFDNVNRLKVLRASEVNKQIKEIEWKSKHEYEFVNVLINNALEWRCMKNKQTKKTTTTISVLLLSTQTNSFNFKNNWGSQHLLSHRNHNQVEQVVPNNA